MTTSFKICGFSFRHYLNYLIIYSPIKVKKLRFFCGSITTLPEVESPDQTGHPDFPSKLYPLKKMYESLNKLPAGNVIVMLDSCFSGRDESGFNIL